MVTGDYHHTAVAVARDVGMVSRDCQVVVIDVPHRETVRLDVASPPSSEADSSNAASPPLSPSSSLKHRQAEFAHGFFGTSLGSKQSSAAKEEADKGAVVRPSFEADKAIRNASLEADIKRVSFGATPGKVSLHLQEASGRKPPVKAAAVSAPLELPGSDTFDSLLYGGDSIFQQELSRKTSLQPIRSSGSSGLLTMLPEAATGVLPLQPTRSRLPPLPTLSRPGSGPLSTVPQTLSRLGSGLAPASSPLKPLLTKTASLTRLPSQIPLAVLASLPEIAADDISIHSRNTSETSSKALLNFRQQLVQASSKLLHPGQQSQAPAYVPPVSALRGLTFTLGTGRQRMEPRDAVRSMAEATLQCAVTAEAFEHLLQMQDMSVLEAVMRSAVVFSRMQPHQKGQVVDLLGVRGIHQPFQGQPRHVQVQQCLG